MTDDLQERAREVLREVRGGANHHRDDDVIECMLAFASPTPEPSGAVVREVEEACRLVEYDMAHRRMTPGNGFITQTTDVATIINYVRASLDAGSASS